jgi:hypothetical protein
MTNDKYKIIGAIGVIASVFFIMLEVVRYVEKSIVEIQGIKSEQVLADSNIEMLLSKTATSASEIEALKSDYRESAIAMDGIKNTLNQCVTQDQFQHFGYVMHQDNQDINKILSQNQTESAKEFSNVYKTIIRLVN